MENKKTEKKRIFSKLTVCVAALALVSCAFVGGTFARYTSGEFTTPGGVNVADWNVEIIDEGIDIFEMAPNYEKYTGTDYDEAKVRSYTVSAGGQILKIINHGQVDAKVTIKVKADSMVMEDKNGEAITLPTYSVVDGEERNPEWKGVGINDIFVIDTPLTVQYSGETTALTADTTSEPGYSIYTATIKTNEYVTVSVGSVKWTSDFESDGTNCGTYGDLRDTWIGTKVAKIGYEMKWSADQAGNVPATGGTPAP